MNERISVSDLQKEFAVIYNSANSGLSPAEIIIRIDEQIGYLGKALFDDQSLEPWLIRAISWIFALTNKLDIDLETALLKKYPNYCPYCLEAPCVCARTNKTPGYSARREEELDGFYNSLINSSMFRKKNANIQFFLEVLRNIYPANFVRWKESKWVFLVKLAEERAEIIESYRRHVLAGSTSTKTPIASEIADLVAWLFSLWDLSHASISNYCIQTRIAERYRFGCPYCKAAKCKCSAELRFGIRSDSSLSAAAEYEPDVRKRLTMALNEIMAAVETVPKLQEHKHSISQLLPLNPTSETITVELKALQESLNTTDVPAKESGRIGKLIKGLIEWLSMNDLK